MSDELTQQQWPVSTLIGSGVSAFVIGASMASGVGLLAGNGKLNTAAVIGIAVAGSLAAAKDYRALKRLPPVRTNGGDSDPRAFTKP